MLHILTAGYSDSYSIAGLYEGPPDANLAEAIYDYVRQYTHKLDKASLERSEVEPKDKKHFAAFLRSRGFTSMEHKEANLDPYHEVFSIQFTAQKLPEK